MIIIENYCRNNILASLPEKELTMLKPHLEYITLLLGEMIQEPGKAMQYAYFPTTSIVSIHYVTESGSSAETAGVGNEGILGVALFMGAGTTLSSAVVQTSGHAFRLDRRILKDAFNRSGEFHRLLLRYTQALMTQIAQNAACNRHHSVEQQLSRWLLLTLDRLPAQELIMTQELVANMLGVRREGITEAAGNLQAAGFISYRRGHISVLDRYGLEKKTCECYRLIKNELNRLLFYPATNSAVID